MRQLKLSTNKFGGLVIRSVQLAPVTITEDAKAYLKEHIGDLLSLHLTFGPE